MTRTNRFHRTDAARQRQQKGQAHHGKKQDKVRAVKRHLRETQKKPELDNHACPGQTGGEHREAQGAAMVCSQPAKLVANLSPVFAESL